MRCRSNAGRWPGAATGRPRRALRQAAQALSLATGDGHVCLPLADLDGGEDRPRDALLAQRRGRHAAAPGARPLILDDDDRLYLHRYFDYERRLARRLMRAAAGAAGGRGRGHAQRLDALFGHAAPGPTGRSSPPRWRCASGWW